MSRARNIKPGFFRNESLAECAPLARLLFVGLWMLADRNGNLENRPKRIKGEIFPYDNCNIGTLLKQLIARGLIVPYRASDLSLFTIPTFKSHQNPHVAEKPKYPEPDASMVLAPVQHGSHRAESLFSESLSLNPDIPPSGAEFDSFWKAYPKKVAKGAARKAWLKCAHAHALILADLSTRAWSEPKFIPHPATYLNAERWLDERIVTVAPVAAPRNQAEADRVAEIVKRSGEIALAKRMAK
jgi:hypothetical protein